MNISLASLIGLASSFGGGRVLAGIACVSLSETSLAEAKENTLTCPGRSRGWNYCWQLWMWSGEVPISRKTWLMGTWFQ
jgi:hypothetical protein